MDVECTIHRITNLLPPALGFPYVAAALDFLHTFCTGVASKVVLIIDASIMKGFRKDNVTRTKDDVHGLVDGSLSLVPPYPGLLNFKHGWWEASNTKAASGADTLALLSQLPFAYVGSDTLIPDEKMRLRLFLVHWTIVCLAQELKTPQWYLDSELCDLEARLKWITQEFIFFHGLFGNGLSRVWLEYH